MTAPLIETRLNAEGVGRAGLAGTRLYVWQVAEWLREPGATVTSVADGLDIPPHLVAAARHAAAHPDAIARDRGDAAAAWLRHGGPPAGQ